MSTFRYLGICALVFGGSFIGSLVANRGVATVHAQMPGTTDMRARSFTVINPQGRTIAALRANGSGAELMLSGRRAAWIEIDGSGGISIHNDAGRLVWSAPGKGVMPLSE